MLSRFDYQILLLVALLFGFSSGFSHALRPTYQSRRFSPTSTVTLHMALLPVGPFCPFRSEAAETLDPRMEELNSQLTPDFSTEMQRFQLDMQMGQTPNPDRLRKVADGIDQSVDVWENLVTRLRISPDFQSREYAKLTQAHLASSGMSVEEIGSMMKWQSGCMRAMADNTPPPMPPPNIDLSKMMEQAQQSDKPSPSISAMAAAEQITSDPFKDTSVIESPTVKEEYEKLCRDHAYLIEFGAKYDTFDPLGKIRYLDEIEKIEERWEVFFARASLMGKLNEEFVKQCNAFLDSMNLNEDEYRKLLKKSHQLMREEAEAERNRLGML